MAAAGTPKFHLEEATIADIQAAIIDRRLTASQLVKLYLARIKAYNGPGVAEPEGMLGKVQVIAHAKGINALSTLNLRPAALKAWGFDEHHARSLTDRVDDDPNMPDALEVAARLDAEFARTGRLSGPLHGVVIGIKDQYDTFDLRTTSGADAPYVNDRPPHDSTFVKRLRAAGAIIIGKTNLSEYADGTPRSSFGGTFVNAYDTTRHPNASSSGSGSAVAANLVTVAIAEESTSSIRGPAVAESCVGLAGTVELVSHVGMIGTGLHTRVGPIARTVEDAARIETVIAGYDALDPMTAFNVGRLPTQPYEAFTHARTLTGKRIGVVREYMDKALFTKADEESIDLVDQAIVKLKELGATIVDPGPHGELFTPYIRALGPGLENAVFAKLHPAEFPVDKQGQPAGDFIATLVDYAIDPAKAPGHFTLRDLGGAEWGGGYGGGGGRGAGGGEGGPAASIGESRFLNNLYLRQRGDPNIRSQTDWYTKATFYDDGRYPNRKGTLRNGDKIMVLDTAARLQRRFAVQLIVLQAFADLKLDAVVYPTTNLPPARLGEPAEPPINGRSNLWTFLGQQGFPAITVPAGFTTQVYDRERDANAPPPVAGPDGEVNPNSGPSHLIGPVAAVLPVGVDFLGRPFSEPTLLAIAAAYEQATKHRHPPPDFGPLPGEP
jgi:Asp-tRNA(Asn)/Glu-tRNA(Gln) amidotransferase A subunit family amidase